MYSILHRSCILWIVYRLYCNCMYKYNTGSYNGRLDIFTESGSQSQPPYSPFSLPKDYFFQRVFLFFHSFYSFYSLFFPLLFLFAIFIFQFSIFNFLFRFKFYFLFNT